MKSDYATARRRMVDNQLRSRDITDPRVLEAMLKVPRHIFVEEALHSQAYSDRPLQIGEYQTISQPYMVALMTQLLSLKGDETVLEIGTGSGYQAAILAELSDRVYTVERLASLQTRARQALDQLGYANVRMKVGDGTLGWPEEGPFDGIVVTAGAPEIPQTLVSQLKTGGRLVIPVGDQDTQMLKVLTLTERGPQITNATRCRFVRLIGQSGWQA
ncbi:MAG: protein-L-isoaspartate(D-aspartate) O-methyltransferase [Deltaproteobacteria bacterium]|nr:protein-L-isoaspartate(D-aspartate) O-methyltransferase [Deltaproteobacteria bacterium]